MLVGDLVNKGPKSIECIELAMERQYLAVCGNHELASLWFVFALWRYVECACAPVCLCACVPV